MLTVILSMIGGDGDGDGDDDGAVTLQVQGLPVEHSFKQVNALQTCFALALENFQLRKPATLPCKTATPHNV